MCDCLANVSILLEWHSYTVLQPQAAVAAWSTVPRQLHMCMCWIMLCPSFHNTDCNEASTRQELLHMELGIEVC